MYNKGIENLGMESGTYLSSYVTSLQVPILLDEKSLLSLHEYVLHTGVGRPGGSVGNLETF